jgi:hypothetical protein
MPKAPTARTLFIETRRLHGVEIPAARQASEGNEQWGLVREGVLLSFSFVESKPMFTIPTSSSSALDDKEEIGVGNFYPTRGAHVSG